MADWGVSEYLLLASAASAAVTGYSAYEQGQAQESMQRYQAAVATNNKILADQYAEQSILKGQRLEESKRMETAHREGAIRAAAGAGGLILDEGSPLRLQEDTARLGELDAQTIRDNAARESYGFHVQGMSYAAQAQLDEMGAQNASQAGALGAWSSIIGGAATVSDRWSRLAQSGKTPFGFGG